MGNDDSSIDNNPCSQIINYPKSIMQVSRAICKIQTPNKVGTGFLIKFRKGEEDFFCLMSNEHIIEKSLIENKEKIEFSYDNEIEKKEILLDINERYIKDFRDIDIDATVVEILKSDCIDEDYFLLPNINYMYDLTELNNKIIQIPQYPEGGNFKFSEGKIIGINNKQLIHKGSTLRSSSGSPLFIKDTIEVIGIHKSGNRKKEENYGDSIGPIYNFIKNGCKYTN